MDSSPRIQALGDIQIAVKAMQEEEESLEHPVDKHYKTLHCALSPLDHEHPDFEVHLLTYSPVQLYKLKSSDFDILVHIPFVFTIIIIKKIYIVASATHSHSYSGKVLNFLAALTRSFSSFLQLFRQGEEMLVILEI